MTESVLLLSPPAMMALLTRPGEGVAYLAQLGVNLAPVLTTKEVGRVQEAVAPGTWEPAELNVELLTALLRAIEGAESRVTLVAELEVRRSLVAFQTEEGVAVIVFSGESIVSGLMTSVQFRDLVAETVVDAANVGVHWNLARWRGDRREASASGTGEAVLLGGTNVELTRSAKAAGSLTSLTAAIVGQSGGSRSATR